MSGDVDVAEALRAALRRASDPVALALSFLGAGSGMLITLALHAGGLASSTQPGHAIANYAVTVITSACTLVVTSLTFAAMALRVSARERGEPLSFGAALADGFARLHLVYAAQVVTSVATVLGAICLVLPGLYAAIVLSLAATLAALERIGPIAVVQRCRELSAGRLRAIASVVLSIWLLIGIVIVIATSVAGLWLPHTGGSSFLASMRAVSALDTPPMVIAILIARGIYGALWAATTTVLYLRLSTRDQPTQGERIAEVFR